MRKPRTLAEPGRPGLYHVCSRVVDRRVIFGSRERCKFLGLVKGGARFTGAELVTWCLMGNHFHLLVRLPPINTDALTDEQVLSRMEHIYSPQKMRHFRGIWERINTPQGRREFLAPFRARMGNLSEFVKTLKQRFTQWFNRRQNREGTLWEGRFFSVLLSHNESEDGSGLGLLARFVAGYIDLNPVRAGVAGRADESTWSGYGAALRGDTEGLGGLRLLWGKNAQEARDDQNLLKMHSEMLARAQFRDQKHKGSERSQSASSDGPAPKQRHGHGHGLDPPEKTKNRNTPASVMASESEPEGWEATFPHAVELRLFSLMSQRCEALTKGRALDRRWLLSLRT